MPEALLLDDDTCCRSVCRDILLRAGFSSVSEMCDIEAHSDFDVLVADVADSGADGGAASAGKIRQQFPDIRVLFISGWPLGLVISEGLIDPVEWPNDHTAFLQKPFTSGVLRDAIRGLLAGTRVSLAAAAAA